MSGVPRSTRVHPDDGSFYVGYLPLDGSLRPRLALAVAIALVWIAGVSGVIAMSMRDPGPAVWDTGTQRSWDGVLSMDPYPMLHTPDGSLLVVGVGKFGVHSRLRPHDGARVTLSGFELKRDGRRMIELSLEDDAVTVGGPSDWPIGIETSRARDFAAIGEIVDGKCFHGAMKPGDGMGHRACAVLCIQGGLPPMFAYEDAGETRFALLLVGGEARLGPESIGLVARRVRVEGSLEVIGGIEVLRVGSASAISPVD